MRREGKDEYDIEGIPLKKPGEVDGEDKQRGGKELAGGHGLMEGIHIMREVTVCVSGWGQGVC